MHATHPVHRAPVATNRAGAAREDHRPGARQPGSPTGARARPGRAPDQPGAPHGLSGVGARGGRRHPAARVTAWYRGPSAPSGGPAPVAPAAAPGLVALLDAHERDPAGPVPARRRPRPLPRRARADPARAGRRLGVPAARARVRPDLPVRPAARQARGSPARRPGFSLTHAGASWASRSTAARSGSTSSRSATLADLAEHGRATSGRRPSDVAGPAGFFRAVDPQGGPAQGDRRRAGQPDGGDHASTARRCGRGPGPARRPGRCGCGTWAPPAAAVAGSAALRRGAAEARRCRTPGGRRPDAACGVACSRWAAELSVGRGDAWAGAVGAAPRHGRVLRLRRAAHPAHPARAAGARRRPRPARGGGRGELPGAGVRGALGDADGPGPAAVPARRRAPPARSRSTGPCPSR